MIGLGLGLGIGQNYGSAGAGGGGSSGNFGAVFTAQGLTVLHYIRSDLGLTKTGSIINSWAAQTGPTITELTGAAGIGSAGTGLNSHPSIISNGSTQVGTYTLALPAPGTTPTFIWFVARLLSAPNTPNILFTDSALAGYSVFVNNGTTNMYINDGSGAIGPVTMATNTWGCGEIVAANNGATDTIKFGAGAALNTGFQIGNNSSSTRGIFGSPSGGAVKGNFELLTAVFGTGSGASLATAFGNAKTLAQSFYGVSVT